MKPFLALALLALTMAVPPPLVAKSTEDVERAIQVLASTDIVMSAHVGAAGLLSHNTEAYRILAQQKDSADAFRAVYRKSGNAAGKIYGLLGLYQTSKSEFETLSHAVKPDAPVPTILGCNIMPQTGRALLKQIEDGSLLMTVNPPERSPR